MKITQLKEHCLRTVCDCCKYYKKCGGYETNTINTNIDDSMKNISKKLPELFRKEKISKLLS